MVNFRQRVEIETIHSILPDLSHYQLLKLPPISTATDIDKAFRKESRIFHPDRFYGLKDEELKQLVHNIYTRIGESYAVLKEPALRVFYDKKLGEGDRYRTATRDALESARTAAVSGQAVVTHPKAKRFYQLAQKARDNKDWNGTVMNLQFALTFEPGNEVVKQELNTAREHLAEKRKAKQTEGNYKIRIV